MHSWTCLLTLSTLLLLFQRFYNFLLFHMFHLNPTELANISRKDTDKLVIGYRNSFDEGRSRRGKKKVEEGIAFTDELGNMRSMNRGSPGYEGYSQRVTRSFSAPVRPPSAEPAMQEDSVGPIRKPKRSRTNSKRGRTVSRSNSAESITVYDDSESELASPLNFTFSPTLFFAEDETDESTGSHSPSFELFSTIPNGIGLGIFDVVPETNLHFLSAGGDDMALDWYAMATNDLMLEDPTAFNSFPYSGYSSMMPIDPPSDASDLVGEFLRISD